MTNNRAAQEFDLCFSGRKLYGDDFSIDEITQWYNDEAEGYAGLIASEGPSRKYPYHALNTIHGFSRLPDRPFAHALGFGSAYGDEFLPIIDKISRISILDPSDAFPVSSIKGVPVDYRKPEKSGVIRFDGDTFDFVSCFGVLHHVPNVSFVISEIGRVMMPGGYALLREPIVNMGDWRRPRPGLTKRERGIPASIMDRAFASANLTIVGRAPCMFPGTPRLSSFISAGAPYDSRTIVLIDRLISRCLSRNMSYNRDKFYKKLAPSCLFWVVRKDVR